MIETLLYFVFRHKLLFIALSLFLVGLGVWSFRRLKIEAYPDISDTGVVVITLYPGQAAEEMERQITVPIELALNNVPNVIARRSRTIFGLSVVELTFADGTDDYFARQLALEKLRDATLPEGVTPALGPLSTGISEFFRYVLRGEGHDAMKLREIQDWIVTPRLLQVSGVADVTTFGGVVKQFQVELDQLKLEKYRLTIARIAGAVGANNRNGGGAMLSNRQQSMAVRGVGLIESVADIEDIVVDASGGVPIYVRDVGKVSVGAAPQTGVFSLSDQSGEYQGGVEGIVLMRRWENPSEVLRRIHEAVEELNALRLPPGVKIVPVHDRTELVENTLHTVSRTLLEGFVVVTAVLLLLLGSLRAALLTALTIPLSMLFAFICMYFGGIPANLLSLGALDFGILVDGTVVMVEHIVFLLDDARRRGLRGAEQETIQTASLEVSRPIFFSLLIVISAYIPLFALERVERRMFTPMAYTVCFALIGSMLVALTLVPVLSAYLFRGEQRRWENPLLRRLYDRYENAVRATLRRAKLTVAVIGAVVLASFALVRFLGSEFLPQLDEGVIWVRANLPSGIALEKSAEVADQMRAIIKQAPEVDLVMSQTGRNDSGADPFGPNRNEILISLKPYSVWESGKTKRELVSELSQKLNASIPGAALNFTQPIIDTSTEIATGSSADLAVIIIGPDLGELRRLAAATLDMLRRAPGAADTSIEQEPDQPQLRLRINRREVARYGINVSDVQDVIEMAIGGRAVSTLYEGEMRFDITVRYAPESRADAMAIGRILVETKDGGRVPLAQLADIQIVNGASIIARRENKRQVTVRANIRGRDQGSFVEEAQRRFRNEVKLPPGYSVAWGGQFENLERARKRLTIILPVTIAIIFTLLFSAFGNAKDAALALVNVPFSLVGGIVALYLRGIPLSVSAAVGFVSLFGVAVMSGLLYIAEINRRRAEPGMTLEEAVVMGARAQMRPRLILITVAMLGMLPAALATGIGSDVQRPLATVVVGGLFSTLFLTLIALPSLYYLMTRFRSGGDSRRPTVDSNHELETDNE